MTKLNSENQSRRALAALLRQASTYGSAAFLGLCDVFGPDWLQWEGKTVQLEIKDELGVLVEPDLFDKIMAARQVVTTDLVFRELPAFITVCNALNGDGVDTPVAQPIAPGDLAWAVLEMSLLYPPSAAETFSEEIVGYMEECLRWQGVIGVPNALVNILPDAKYDETVFTDSDTTQLCFERLVDVNAEVTSHLNAWRFQLSQLKLVNGDVSSLLERYQTK